MKVHLLRHIDIETDTNTVQGVDDRIVLDDKAFAKIEDYKKKFASIEKVYSSNLNRAKRTAELIFPDKVHDIVYTDLLNEYIRPSRFIGGPKSDLIHFWEEEHKSEKYNAAWKPEDGESYKECAERALAFHKLLLKDKESGVKEVVIIGHGTLFRHLLCSLTGVEWQDSPAVIIDLLRLFPWKNLEEKQVEI